MDSFSESKNWARVRAGLSGGEMFKSVSRPPRLTFADLPMLREKFQYRAVPQGTPVDSWNQRRNRG